MANEKNISTAFIWRLMRRFNQNTIKMFVRPNRPGPDVLLLTTVGRKTGLSHVTPLQYEEINGKYYVGALRGRKADWYRNLQKNPQGEVQIKSEKFAATAEPILQMKAIADLLEYRLQKHPLMIRFLLLTHGLPLFPKRSHFEQLAKEVVFVVLQRV